MTYPALLADDDKRARLLDLAFSLYECLGDLIADSVVIDDADEEDQAMFTDRISTSAMNCLADMKLLVPMLNQLTR